MFHLHILFLFPPKRRTAAATVPKAKLTVLQSSMTYAHCIASTKCTPRVRVLDEILQLMGSSVPYPPPPTPPPPPLIFLLASYSLIGLIRLFNKYSPPCFRLLIPSATEIDPFLFREDSITYNAMRSLQCSYISDKVKLRQGKDKARKDKSK